MVKIDVIPQNEVYRKDILDMAAIKAVETIKIKSIGMVNERTKEQKKIIEEVAATLGV